MNHTFILFFLRWSYNIMIETRRKGEIGSSKTRECVYGNPMKTSTDQGVQRIPNEKGEGIHPVLQFDRRNK